MAIYVNDDRDETPSPICKYCGNVTVYYEGLDTDNETADVRIRCCDRTRDCTVMDIDWVEFFNEEIKK